MTMVATTMARAVSDERANPALHSGANTVLVVEDDQNIARALGARLVASGFQVANAYDASTALMVAKRTDPDLVVLDISMPGGDGFVVAERLRKWRGSALPLIFITASQQAGLMERAEGFNARAFLRKPFAGKDLVATIEAAL